MEKYRGWVRGRPVVWTVGALVLGLVLGAGALAASNSSLEDEKGDLEKQVDILTGERDDAEAEVAVAQDKVREVTGRRDEILDTARTKARRLVGKAEGEAAELAGIEGEIDAAEQRLGRVEASIGTARDEAARSTIEDGIWQLEADYVAGTYRAPGGEGCYWALLGSADTSDIINNGGFGPNQTLTIDSPWFETSDCGTWERISE